MNDIFALKTMARIREELFTHSPKNCHQIDSEPWEKHARVEYEDLTEHVEKELKNLESALAEEKPKVERIVIIRNYNSAGVWGQPPISPKYDGFDIIAERPTPPPSPHEWIWIPGREYGPGDNHYRERPIKPGMKITYQFETCKHCGVRRYDSDDPNCKARRETPA